MKEQVKEFQYTIRGIPAEVDRALRSRARSRKQSLNQIVVEELVAATQTSRKVADFSDVTGQWVADPAFDEIVAAQRSVDLDQWK